VWRFLEHPTLEVLDASKNQPVFAGQVPLVVSSQIESMHNFSLLITYLAFAQIDENLKINYRFALGVHEKCCVF